MNQVWTESDKNFVKTNANRLTDRELAVELGKISGRNVTLAAARKLRQRLGINKENGRGVCRIKKK